ncbi:MAG: nucleotidyltransferase family protein [Sphingomicrobium sp.]
MHLSGEFRLIAEYCGHTAARRSADEAPEPPPQLDWPLFLRLVRFHRVQGVVWPAMRALSDRLPSEVSDAIAADAMEIAATNLRASAASRELLEDFAGAGVRLLFFKGLTLGALAYGDISTKSAIDIDLLVAPAEVVEAARLLEQREYRLITPGADRDRIAEWHRRSKESLWARARPASLVDLHTRLADTPQLIPRIGPGSASELVEVTDGLRLPTLPLDELFAYLCVHGAWASWFRLKWITDLAALLHERNSLDLYRRSQELGAGRAAAQALLLADALFGTLHAYPAVTRELESEPANRRLLHVALRQLAGRREPIEPTSRPLGTARIHLAEIAMLPGWRSKAAEVLRQLRDVAGR